VKGFSESSGVKAAIASRHFRIAGYSSGSSRLWFATCRARSWRHGNAHSEIFAVECGKRIDRSQTGAKDTKQSARACRNNALKSHLISFDEQNRLLLAGWMPTGRASNKIGFWRSSRFSAIAVLVQQGVTMMKRLALAVVMTMASPLCAVAAAEVAKSPPAAPYQQVSKLVKLPDFLPGMGQLFVDPTALPTGPFLAYDHDGKLVSTIYMLPIKDLNPDKRFDNLAAPGGNVDHVDVYYNAGHPGVEEPHVHVVLWHVSVADEARVAK